ncbi:MAG: site-specific DNA-methyltransferase [Candidatus Omnitrophica bacterium]|nr:site-specific DNA-methyltransferase [Candidatus Omnitrophota bacterium]
MSGYGSLSKEQLIDKIKRLQKRKKFGLVWEDKLEDVAELCKTKLPVLVDEKGEEISDSVAETANVLIEGDNYHALSVLNYTHKGKIDFIYIDPPYNTGAKDWKYNNAFVDAQDPYRHSKWLSFMEKRLKLAKNLLRDQGIICVTIDDYEMPRLWSLMDEIYNESNHLGTVVIRNNPKGRKTKRKVSLIHEYALFYGRSGNAKIQKLEVAPEDKTHNYVKDKDDSWYLPGNLRKQGVDSLAVSPKTGRLSDRYYPIYYDPKTGKVSTTKSKQSIKILPIDKDGQKRIWRRAKQVIDEMFERGDVWYQKTKYGNQIFYKFRGGLDGEPPESIWYESKFSASEHGTQILDTILGVRETFQYPKSPYAVMECIKVATASRDAIILDFFAGSGTTGHAALELNSEDNGNRQFILCTNNENGICRNVCYPRIRKVMAGYTDSKKKKINGLGGNLKYFKTDFVEAEPTDKNKKKLTVQATEMLCLKEGAFRTVVNKKSFKIFKNANHYVGIIFDHTAIPDFKQAIEKLQGKFSVYVFSLGDDAFDEEFEDVKQKVKLSPIPDAILRVYRRIFK